jgi:hypothetical protein
VKLLLENWREYIKEEEWEPSGDKIMFPAKYLFSHMGEYRTEKYWTDFKKLSEEEKIEWAKKVKFDEPIQVTVFADGSFGHGDGHHRAMAGKILDIDIPIIITRNKVKEKSEDLWEAYLSRIRQGNHPKNLNPEQYLMKSIEQMGWDSQTSTKEEEDVNEIFGMGTKKADITSDHMRQMKLLNRQIKEDFGSDQTSWYNHYTKEKLLTLLAPVPEDYRRGIDLVARALVAVRNVQFNDYVFSREYMKSGTKLIEPHRTALELRGTAMTLASGLEFMRKIYGKLIEDYDLHHSDHPIQREIPKDQSLEDLQKLMTGMYVSPENRLEEG